MNNSLRDGDKKRGIEPVFTSRTCRMETIREMNRKKKGSGFEFVQMLFDKNLDDLLTMLKWNEIHGIKVFRMSSEMAPHITNHRLMIKKYKSNPTKLAWSMKPFAAKMRKIGHYAMSHGHRLTFHPGQFVVIGSPNPAVVTSSIRDLYWHSLVMDMMKLDMNCVINIHGGGIYGDKEAAIWRWVHTFNNMPIAAKRRIVLENDEESYSIEDVLEISRRVKWQHGMIRTDSEYKIPITFDVFHYYCYNKTLLRRHDGISELEEQRSIAQLLPEIAKTWGDRRPKMHISEQLRGGSVGSHADYVRIIPQELLRFSRHVGFDLYIEAKEKEKAVIYLMKKYKKFLEK
jgi:UV DNA damage endonuclease